MITNIYTVRQFKSLNGDVYKCDQRKDLFGLELQEESKRRIEEVTGKKVNNVEWWATWKIHVNFHDFDKALVCFQI
jgi:hypothetical protein